MAQDRKRSVICGLVATVEDALLHDSPQGVNPFPEREN